MRVPILLLCCAVIVGCSKRTEGEELEKAAAQGNAGAQLWLGFMYASGRGIPKDEAKAVEWFQKAADQRNAGAQVWLAFMYASGRGVPRDGAKAVEWYQNAAFQGDFTAKYTLGFMYANGRGVPKDDVRAYAWLSLAAAQSGSDELAKAQAAASRDLLEKRMTVTERSQAQDLSGELFEKMPKK